MGKLPEFQEVTLKFHKLIASIYKYRRIIINLKIGFCQFNIYT